MTQLLDFLPYVDQELQVKPELRDEVDAMIEQECAQRRRAEPFDPEAFLQSQGFESSRNEPLKDPAASTSGNPFLRSELQRVMQNGPADTNAITEDPTYKLVECPKEDAATDVWEAALRHNTLILERLDNDLLDVELQAQFGPSAWKVYAQTMEGLAQRVKDRLLDVEQDILAINQARKRSHLAAGERERKLRNKWLDHINQIRLIQKALAEASLGRTDSAMAAASDASGGNQTIEKNTNADVPDETRPHHSNQDHGKEDAEEAFSSSPRAAKRQKT